MTTNNELAKDNNVPSKSLTEQWKKGELKGEYYIETNDGKQYICELQTKSGVKNKLLPFAKNFNGYVTNKSVAEVLAPVPSYEEWQQMKAFCEEFNALDVAQENKRLKELLKECSPYVARSATSRMIKNSVGHKKDMNLLTKIDEVLK